MVFFSSSLWVRLRWIRNILIEYRICNEALQNSEAQRSVRNRRAHRCHNVGRATFIAMSAQSRGTLITWLRGQLYDRTVEFTQARHCGGPIKRNQVTFGSSIRRTRYSHRNISVQHAILIINQYANVGGVKSTTVCWNINNQFHLDSAYKHTVLISHVRIGIVIWIPNKSYICPSTCRRRSRPLCTPRHNMGNQCHRLQFHSASAE